MSWSDIEGGNTSSRTPKTKFDTGTTIIRVIDGEPFSYWSHWMVKQRMGVSCLGTDCPICDVVKQQKADGVDAKDKTYTSTKRHAMRIINRNTGQLEIMIQGKEFMNTLYTFHKEIGDIRNYDIKVVRKGTDTSTTYTMLPVQPTELSEEDKALITDVDVQQEMAPFDKEVILQLMMGKTLKEIFGQGDEEQ